MSTLTIVLIIIGVMFVLIGGTCAAGVIFVQREAKKIEADLKEGGALVLAAPVDVLRDLAGPKKDYVGAWKSKKGSELIIDGTGNLRLDKDEDGDGVKEKLQAPIARFDGNDIVVKEFVTFTTKVTEPPHKVGDHWEMIADGIRFTRQ